MEFTGEAITGLPMSDRLAMCNMAIEAGAKNGIIAPDEITREYVTDRALRPFTFYASDPGADYAGVKEYDVSALEPQVAFPASAGKYASRFHRWGRSPLIRRSSAPAPMGVWRICAWRPRC